jgi:hypothetical protein
VGFLNSRYSLVPKPGRYLLKVKMDLLMIIAGRETSRFQNGPHDPGPTWTLLMSLLVILQESYESLKAGFHNSRYSAFFQNQADII